MYEADFDIPVQFQRLRREAVLALRTNPNEADLAGLADFFLSAAVAAGYVAPEAPEGE